MSQETYSPMLNVTEIDKLIQESKTEQEKLIYTAIKTLADMHRPSNITEKMYYNIDGTYDLVISFNDCRY